MHAKDVKFSEEIAKKWIRALKSGDFEQGKGQLARHRSDGIEYFCCLGVLKSTLDIKSDSACYIADLVLGEMGSEINVFYLLPGEIQKKLAEMNDDGASFRQIAAYIKKNYKSWI